MGLATRREGRTGGERAVALVDIALLGPLVVSRAGQRLEVTGPKQRALLALLALEPGVPLTRERIVDALWSPPATGREGSTLRVHVSRLRDVLEPDRGTSPHVLLTVGSGYLLAADRVSIDIDRFDAAAKEGRELLSSDPSTALERLNEALSLARGQPLQDVAYEDFAQPTIRRLEEARVAAIEDRAEALIELGEDAAAIEDLDALVRADTIRERPVLLLMRALYRLGRPSESLATARRHERHLRELGLDPSPQLGALEQRILQHDDGLLASRARVNGELRPGRSLRGFELRERVGSGSLGVVYRAFQSSVSRQVALKVVHAPLAGSAAFAQRFVEHVRTFAAFEHPHIVPIHDVWRDPTSAAIATRWMEGGDLASRPPAAWSGEAVVQVFGQLADALAFVHAAGAAHGAVHASNVLLDAAGNAYLGDVGLAALRERDTRRGGRQPDSAARSDLVALGHLLTEVLAGAGIADERLALHLAEVARIATALDAAARYPDAVAFRSALADVPGGAILPAPRRLRRNPYKGLLPFDETDAADFHGRDDVVETLVHAIEGHRLTALIGASGSGKSSIVRAGVVPALRGGGLAGSERWPIATMTPGTDPFDSFHVALRSVAMAGSARLAAGDVGELRESFAAVLTDRTDTAVLVIDQFEELFSSQIDPATRVRFLDGLVELATDPSGRVRVVLTLRADMADRALAHPRCGELVSASSLLLAPMRPEQIEEAIRRPAVRAGLQISPELTATIVRDVISASGALPLLQYVLAELFERRADDRLTLDAYRALGGVHGVLERRAEATFVALPRGAREAGRQLFLRMVHLGDGGEETRRRLPLTELTGLGPRADVDAALTAFVDARLLTRDRDPASRNPTVEVAHETVIRRWTRYRSWIDDARADLLAHRRLVAATRAWHDADEDPDYLLTGGPLAAAAELTTQDRIALNEDERRYLEVSRAAAAAARERDAERRRHEVALRQRAGRRLLAGSLATAIAIVVAGIAAVAWIERQRADDLAAAQERQNTARQLAAASLANLDAGDAELSLLLAIQAAELSRRADEPVLPEVVDALHRSLVTPRPTVQLDGAGSTFSARLLEFSEDASQLTFLTADGGVSIVDAIDGTELGVVQPTGPPAGGVIAHPDGERVLTMHPDGAREWWWRTGELERELLLPGEVELRSAAYGPDGRWVFAGSDDGTIHVWNDGEVVAELRGGGHTGPVAALDVDPTGQRLVSVGPVAVDGQERAWAALVWDVHTGEVTASTRTDTVVLPLQDVAWHPVRDAAVVATAQGDVFLFDTRTGERLNSFGNAQHHANAVAFDRSGIFTVTAGADGIARLYGTWVGGEAAAILPTAGVPVRDVTVATTEADVLVVALVGVDGQVRIYRDLLRSELPAASLPGIYPHAVATPSGDRYLVVTSFPRLLDGQLPMMQVLDAHTLEQLVARPATPWGGERGAAISADGRVVAFAGIAGDVEITEVATGATRSILVSSAWTASLDLDASGTLVAGGGVDGTISIWDTDSLRLVTRLSGHGDRAARHRSAPDGPPAQLGPAALQLFAATTHRVDEVRFDPTGEQLASAGFDATVRLWDVATGEGRILYEFDHEVFSLAYSRDGTLLAASDRVGTVVVLDARTGEVVRDLEPVSGRTELAFSPDGHYLAGAGPGPFAHLWDVSSGSVVRRFHGAVYPPRTVAFVADGTQLRVAGGEGLDRGYVLDPDELVDLAQEQVTRGFTEAECRRYEVLCP